ncbi:MAG: prepilin-type N-terminal cleavage/methylation domain-containing protein [Planctomycetota bacterium]|nr:prepilin-type N-terminal cleavage/methylation domain-containing protein [Planctomycetota bacterium]
MRRRAFTLTELAVVLLVLALLAGAVALRLESPLRRARLEDLAQTIVAFDHLSRVYARQHDRSVRIEVDLAQGRLRRTDTRGQDLGTALELPDGYRVARLMVRGQDYSIGCVAIHCSRLGLTPTYGLLLEGPAGRRQWVLVAGLTGESLEPETLDEVRAVLAATGTGLHAG